MSTPAKLHDQMKARGRRTADTPLTNSPPSRTEAIALIGPVLGAVMAEAVDRTHHLPNSCGYPGPASPTKCAKSTGAEFLESKLQGRPQSAFGGSLDFASESVRKLAIASHSSARVPRSPGFKWPHSH